MVEIRRNPGHCCVAVIAVIATADMSRVLAYSSCPVMTGIAGANDLRVIYRIHGHPDVGRMAVFADSRGLDVGWRLTRSVSAVVAVGAVTRDVHVIEIRGQPANRGMTIVTISSAVYMCRGLPGRYHAVMTGPASSEYLRVIDGERRRPNIRCMTVFADIGRLNMGERFAGSFDAVMAADAVTGDIDVIKVCGQPANCGMTIVARGVAGDMGWVFASCRDAIMARATGTQYLRVVDRIGR